jgi:hypothetical protein
MIELTEEQQRILETRPEWPARVVNPRTQETYVLLPGEIYERVRALLEEEDEIASVREMYPLASRVLEQEEDISKESA